jgi:hypothetical protein
MNWTSAGDLGDIVVSLCVAKHASSQSRLLLRDDGRTKGIVKRQHLITPLVLSQSYITECRPYTPDDTQIDWPAEQFRRGWHSQTSNLMTSHARHAQHCGVITDVPTGAEPWLAIEAKPHGKVVINRTERYNNAAFPWRELVQHLKDQILFVGTSDEYRRFTQSFGEVEYQPTKDLLEVAKLIKGSTYFVGNQSCAMAIAEGLKHPRIQETSLGIPDCIYPGNETAQYVATSQITLPDGTLIGQGLTYKLSDLKPFSEVPRCGWACQFGPHSVSGSTPERTAKDLARLTKMPYEMAQAEVMSYILRRDPGFFRRMVPTQHLTKVAIALEGAGITSHPVHDALAGRITFIP